jgi:hypothetical protein
MNIIFPIFAFIAVCVCGVIHAHNAIKEHENNMDYINKINRG